MINEKYIIKLNGQAFVKYEGLLNEAHEKGLAGIVAEVVQYPDEENKMTCVVSANLHGKNGELYSDVGDASPASCNSKLVPHLIRMASTRAKARVLRDFTNIGMCSVEELGETEINQRPVFSPVRQQLAK